MNSSLCIRAVRFWTTVSCISRDILCLSSSSIHNISELLSFSASLSTFSLFFSSEMLITSFISLILLIISLSSFFFFAFNPSSSDFLFWRLLYSFSLKWLALVELNNSWVLSPLFIISSILLHKAFNSNSIELIL